MFTSFRQSGRRLLLVATLLVALLMSSQTAILSAQAAGSTDPSFVYQTIFNGAEFDSGRDEVVDGAGNAYILARAYDTSNDVMVVKLSPDGEVLFTTYLRGSLTDYGTGLALDGHGGLLVVGFTDSADFPVTNDAAQPVKDNNRSAFLTRLSTADGAIIYSSFFGASRADEFHDVAVNSDGEIYLVGKTDSTDFPTLNPLQANLNLTQCFCDDAFVLRLSADAHTVLYSTYLGGEFDDQGDSIGLDADGNIYIAGTTQSDQFPTANPIQSERSGDQDVWVARISADGTNLDYSTYLGGSDTDHPARIAVDPAGYVTVAGTTKSPDFPSTPASYQPTYGGGDCGLGFQTDPNCDDGFITRLAPDGSSLVYSTFLGGNKDDEIRGVVVDETGNAYVVGYAYATGADGLPTVSIFVSSLDASGSQLRYTVNEFSGVANEGHGIALGPDGDVYFTCAKDVPADLYAARLTENGTPPPSDNSLHVGDLDGSASAQGKKRWQATVTVFVHDAGDNPITNVTVSGDWSNGYSGSAQCVTDATGTCTLTTGNLRNKVKNVTFTVNNLTKSGYTYDFAANHDPDGDSNGTNIVISRP